MIEHTVERDEQQMEATTIEVTCAQSDELRPTLELASSCTNYVAGRVLDYRFPPHTQTTYIAPDGSTILVDRLDANGCQHRQTTIEATAMEDQ